MRRKHCNRARLRVLFGGWLLLGAAFALWVGSACAAGPFAYIPNAGDNTVSVIDIATNTVVATIPISPATGPVAVAVAPTGTSVYVATINPPLCPGGFYPCGLGAGSVVEINATTNTVVNSVSIGPDPIGVAFNSAGTFAYVATAGTSNYDDMGFITVTPPVLNAIQTSNQAETGIAITFAGGVAFNPAGTFAYVTRGNAVEVVNTATKAVVTGPGLPIPAGNGAYGIAMSPNGFAYVGNIYDNTVSVINTATNTVIATIPVGAGPYGIAINPAGTFAYVANYNDATVSVIDTTTNSVVGSPIAVGTHPYGISVSPGGNLVYVANSGDNTVSVIAEPTRAALGAPISVGTGPQAFGQFIAPGPAAVAAPTKFGVYIGPTPRAGVAFNVVIQTQDATSAPQDVATATAVTLSRTTGTGSLSGSLSCTIPAGSSSCSLGSVVYSVAESGVVLTATRTSGDAIPPGHSAPTQIFPVTPTLVVTSINGGTNPTAGIAFDVVVQAQGGGGTPVNVPNASGVALTLVGGSGTLGGGTPTCTIAGGTSSCTVVAITYSKPEAGLKLAATQTSGTLALAAGTSAIFTVNPPASPPQRLVITSVNGGAHPLSGVAFNVVIQVQDGNGVLVNVPADRGVQLMLKAGTGALGGTLTCTISTGTHSCTISGITYSIPEAGVVINASPFLYDVLGAGDSAPFTVDPGPSPSATGLELFPAIPVFTPVVGVPFGLVALSTIGGFEPHNVVLSTLVTLSLHSGTGTLGGTLTCTIPAGSGTCTFAGVTYSKAEAGVSVTATASGGDPLTPVNSPTFTVHPAAAPTQLAIVIFPGTTVGQPFFPLIAAEDGSGVAQKVSAATVVALSVHTGTGTLGGTLTCTIPAGSSLCPPPAVGVTYSKAESGVVITATRTSGDALIAGNSLPLTFKPLPTKLGVSLWSVGDPIAGFPFSLLVSRQDASGTSEIGSLATDISLSVSSGTGTLGGVMTCTIPANSTACILSGVTYSQPEAGVVITATRTSGAPLTPGSSPPLTIDAAPPMPPARLVITSINGGANPTVGVPFSVIVQAQASDGTPQSDSVDTHVALSRATGTGTLGGGPLSCTISANSSSCTVVGVTYSVAQSGVSLAATRTSGDTLAAGTSATFTVNAVPQPPTKLAIISVNGGTSPTVAVGFNVIVQAQDATNSAQNVLANTAVVLSLNTGTGTLGGPNLTCTIVVGSNACTVVSVTYSKAEAGVSLTATRTSGDTLAAGNSAPFTVVSGSGGIAPVIQSAVSRKVHGGAGTFDLPLSLANIHNPTTEPRIGPAQTIVFTFNKAVNGAVAAVTEGTGTAAAPTFSGNDVIVSLTGVTNQQYVTVSLTGVSSTDGGAGGSASVRVGFLLGDVNGNRVISVADLGLVNAQLAQVVTAANFLKDVNASGTLTVADKGITNANLTRSLPAP